MSSEEKTGGFLTTQNVGKLLMLNAERVRQLVKDGYVERAGRNKFALIPAVQGYIRFLKDAERRASRSAAATRMQDIKTKRAELDLKVAQKELLPREDLYAAADFISAAVKNEMLGLPSRITRDLDERAALEDAVRNALNRISKKIERSVGVATQGGDVFAGSSPQNP
jgi:hypothetical protein